jgi:hypothetical protein
LNSYYRSIVCDLGAVRVECGGHGRGERVTAMDHQGYQESHRTRSNDEALGKRIGASVPRCWRGVHPPFLSFPLLRGGTN